MEDLQSFPISYFGKITPETYKTLYNRLDFIEKKIQINDKVNKLK